MRRRRARRAADLTGPQALELSVGPHHRRKGYPPSAFESAADRRTAWFECDQSKLLGAPYVGKRPWAWWHYEAGEPRDRTVPEAEQLRCMGVLTEAEERQLAAWAHRAALPAEDFAEQDAADADQWDDGVW